MHRAFSNYNQSTRIGAGVPPSWMPDSTAAELAQRQNALQQYYQQQANQGQGQAMPMQMTMPMPMPMMMPMPMPYGYPPSTSRRRSPRHHDSDTDTDEDRHRRSSRRHRSQNQHHHSKKRSPPPARRSRRHSSSAESASSVEVRRHRTGKGKHVKRQQSRTPRRRTPSSSSATTETSETSESTSSFVTNTSSSSSSESETASESDDGSSTVSGHSSGRETTLTTNEMIQASATAAARVSSSSPRARSTSLPRSTLAAPTGKDLFMKIQNAYMRYPQPDGTTKFTMPNMEEARVPESVTTIESSRPLSVASASRPSSAYHTAASQAGETDTFRNRMLPRPSLIQAPASMATEALHPVGAEPSSSFSRVGYYPVKSPQLPPEIHVQPSSPSIAPSDTRTSFDGPDPPVISTSRRTSRTTSALFPPLEYEAPLRPSLSRSKRQSMSRANSTFSGRYAPPAPSQIQAAIQHRSVSEAAFPLSEDRLAVPERAYAGSSAGGSRVSASTSATRAMRRQVQDSDFDMVALGPNHPGNSDLEYIPRGDPRFYSPLEEHPYLMKPTPVARQPSHHETQPEYMSGTNGFCGSRC